MGAFGALQSLDEGVSDMLVSWNGYSTGLATLLIGICIYRIATIRDPDVHPLLLARQAEHDRIRMPGESPVYAARYTERLTTGLNVRDKDASGQKQPTWARGRDGDLRDIWSQFLSGAEPTGRNLTGTVEGEAAVAKARGKLLTILGKTVTENKLEDIDHQVRLIGQHLASKGSARVAIYLPNSVELLVALFACSFRLISPILIPFDQSPTALVAMLRETGADTIITAPGVFTLNTASALSDLRHIIWVLDEGNRHLDWHATPGSNVDVCNWQEIVAEKATSGSPSTDDYDKSVAPPEVVTFWQSKDGEGVVKHEVVRFSQANLIAGIAAQTESLPSMAPEDVVLPADSLANAHTLAVTLAALFSNASLAVNAAACRDPSLALVTDASVLCPTVLIATPTTLLQAHADNTTKLAASLQARISHSLKTRSLLRDGRMPSSAGKGLRLIVTADRAGAGTTPLLPPSTLSDLRASTGARIVYAMTAPRVAGAVAQTSAFDYRAAEGEVKPHFGAPLRCVRFMLKDTKDFKNSDEKYQGEIIVKGPAVAGAESRFGVIGTMRADNTLAYV